MGNTQENNLRVRYLTTSDIALIADYWTTSDPQFLIKMGVDLQKLPDRAFFISMLQDQLETAIPVRQSHALIWELDGKAIGHTNANNIEFGKQAFMHLHLWQSDFRKKGLGLELVKLSLPIFFKDLELKKLYCEPYANNPAPNKTLEKIGFKFEKRYKTIPGSINFEQEVNRWVITKEYIQNVSRPKANSNH